MIFVKFLVDELPYYDRYCPYCGVKLSIDNSNKNSY